MKKALPFILIAIIGLALSGCASTQSAAELPVITFDRRRCSYIYI